MGCSAGPKNTIVVTNAKFHFDASMPWASTGATTFLNPFYNLSYSNYTIDSDTNFIALAGTGVSKFLDFKQFQQFKNGLAAVGTFNAVTSFTWIAVVGSGSTSQDNQFLRCDDSTGNFYITSNGNFLHGHAGTSYSSTNLTLLTGGWKHLVLTRNGTSCNLYVNGVSSFTYTLGNNNGITDYNYRSGTFPGSLTDVAYLTWMPGYVSSADEISYHYNRLIKNRFGIT
jgi:hypothetical protein